jgi:uncharacterized protein (DUF1800 family)
MAANDIGTGFLALQRFGYGARGGGDLAAASADPRGFIKSELADASAALLSGPGLPNASLAIQTFFAHADMKKAEAQRKAMLPPEPAMVPAPDAPMQAAPKPEPPPEQQVFRAEVIARLRRAATARVGLVERLVAFWANHFCVSVGKGPFLRISAGAFEREAIRPHVLGKFSNMLRAVETHPSMLFYLDNQQSIGPNSKAGQRSKRGLNENLAREIMELYTLGVNGGYTQADVTSLAKIITGWTFANRAEKLGEAGTFVFNPNAHEPGAQSLLGISYNQDGLAQGEAALENLARHPATAKFIAAKLARHFIADQPPPALVTRLEKTFRETGGDLKAVTLALIDAPEALNAPATKMRSPQEFLIAAMRLTGRTPDDPGVFLGPLNTMGMPWWTPPGPNGFPDTNAAWASPEGIKLRLDVSSQIAARMRDIPNPVELLDAVCGAAASVETRQAVARAESKQQGLAILLMSPEMQRR